MNTLIFIAPLLLGIVGNVFYNIVGKSTPEKINPFISLAATYFVALLICLGLFFVTSGEKSFLAAAAVADWTSYSLGICIVFTDLSLILLFRANWDISIGSLIANIACSVIVSVIGVAAFGESMTLTKLVGILLCLAGLYVINAPEKSPNRIGDSADTART